MFQSFRKFSAILMVGALTLSMTSVAFAEASTSNKSVTGFFRRLFNYPVKATKETAEMTSNTLQNTGEKVLAKTGEELSQGKAEGLVQPVVGAVETTGQTAVETVQIPVKAAEEEEPTASETTQQ